ncbi:uncharacterized protein [Miscanthus floridulus]|uniref:uncharacterized protein n=1 Tax=Miscanthus floridulus TaxID=154761 RepID=UPI00345A3DE9
MVCAVGRERARRQQGCDGGKLGPPAMVDAAALSATEGQSEKGRVRESAERAWRAPGFTKCTPPSAPAAPQSLVLGAPTSRPRASGAHLLAPSSPPSGLGGTATAAPSTSPAIELGSGSGPTGAPSASASAAPVDIQSQAAGSRAGRTAATQP